MIRSSFRAGSEVTLIPFEGRFRVTSRRPRLPIERRVITLRTGGGAFFPKHFLKEVSVHVPEQEINIRAERSFQSAGGGESNGQEQPDIPTGVMSNLNVRSLYCQVTS